MRSYPEQIDIRVTTEMKDALNAAAEARGLTREWIIRKLLTEGLANMRPAEEMRLTRPLTDGSEK